MSPKLTGLTVILSVNLTLIEFIVLPIVATIFGIALYFFIKSRKTLKATLDANKKYAGLTPKKEKNASYKRNKVVELEEQFARMRNETVLKKAEPELPPKKVVKEDGNLIHDLKSTIAQQQKLLNTYLQKVEDLENEGREELNRKINDLEREIHKLHLVIEKKDEEANDLQQQAAAAQKMAAKIEEVYQEFDQLQNKMTALEKQASRANNLAIELEDTRQSYEQVHKELLRKHEKMEGIMAENQSMRQAMNELEDKLADANLQRQQLQKKVQFLTDLNNDMQNISETNKKLQTELRRIGELESMLNLMAEERDYLLRKKRDQ